MTHARRIAVGVDGSVASEVALEWALQEAVRRGWGLDVICSYSLPSFTAASLDGGYAALDDTAIRESAQSALDDALALASGRGIDVAGRLETGDPAGALIDASTTAGLAVIGSRGGGGFTDRLLGTVSTAVPAHARCPVVVVPARARKDASRPAVTPPRRIVVGVDGSPSARIALAAAIHEAVLWDAELIVVGAVPLATGTGVLPWLPANLDRAQLLADVEAALAVVVEEVRVEVGQRIDIVSRVLDGTGAALLIEFSTAVDLIVVGSRGRGGFAGMLLGSTSQSVLHHAGCPVLVVPARTHREDNPPATFPWEN